MSKKGGRFIVAGLEYTGSFEAFTFFKVIATLLFSGIEIAIFVSQSIHIITMLIKLPLRTNFKVPTAIILLYAISALILKEHLEIGIYLPA